MEERKVIVKDKKGKLLAIFSNKTPAQSNSDKKNLMVSPTIDIVSNGESTLSFQMFVSSEKWQAIKNPENLYYCNGRVYTAINEQSYVYNGPIVNVTLVEIWYLLAYKYVQAHNIDTSVEAVDDHTIKILPKTDSSKFKLTVNGIKYEDSQVKDSRGVVMPRGSAGYALWAILKGTDWKLGVCDVLPDGFDAANDYGSFNVETDMKDVLYNIQFIQQLYGGILDWDSENKVLNLRDETKEGTDFNTWKGFSIRKGKNLSDYPVVTWDNSIINRLYPLGNGNLNIKKVNNNKGYVEDFSYTTDVYEGYMQNPNIYDTNDEGGQKTLKYWGNLQVKKYCKPRKSISYTISDPRSIESQSHEKFDINHIAKSYYQDTESGKEIYEMLRIQHLNYNWFFPGNNSVIEVGDKISNEVELFYQIYKQNENSAPTDSNGHLSGNDIYLEVPEEYWDELFGGFGYASLQQITNLHAEHETENTVAIADLRVYADDTFATITSFTEFQEWTEDEFKASSTRIEQVSTALSAQIELEALHHEESLEYTQESVANLKLYVDGDFAEAQLSAAYAYADEKAEDLSNSLAEFRAYADRTYALASVSATYDYVNQKTNEVSNALSEFKAYANGNFAYASVSATYSYVDSQVNALNSSIASVKATADRASSSVSAIASGGIQGSAYLDLYQDPTNASASLGVNTGGYIDISGYITIYSPGSILLSSGSIQILGKNCYWRNGYLRGN